MVRRHEILINKDQVGPFMMFYLDYFDLHENIQSPSYFIYDHHRLQFILHVDDEFMVLARLKFQMTELEPWGTSIEFGSN